MPRKLRIYSNSKIYYIILKGIDDQDVFYDNEDRVVFLENVLATKEKFKYKVCAYCLMSNHIHMVIQVEDEFLSKSMQSLTIRYVHYFNKKYDRKGPFVLNRFKSKNVENLKYFLDVCRYVHRNPEKAGIEKTYNYRWSSYKEYIGKEKIIEKNLLMHYLNNDINDFIKYTNKADSLEELEKMADFELKSILTDDELIGIIIKKFNLNSAEEINSYFKTNKALKVKELKTIAGTNKNQLARIIRVGYKTIEKIWNNDQKENRSQIG